MTKEQPTFLDDIESFISETGMGSAYFGQRAVGNSKLVSRLRAGRPVLSRTEERVRDFISSVRQSKGEAA